jgi:hypothetical protein
MKDNPMLSDSCADFVAMHAENDLPVEQNVRRLAEGIEHYSKLSWSDVYGSARGPGGQLDALRRATKRVITRPDDKDALLWLLMLAECVRSYYDGALTGDDVEDWCERWLKKWEDVASGRCPDCGATTAR